MKSEFPDQALATRGGLLQLTGPLRVAALAALALTTFAGCKGDDASAPDQSTTPMTTPVTPSPTPEKTQSPQTWADTAHAATDGYEWDVPDPLQAARDAWFAVVAEHLDPNGEHLGPFDDSSPWGVGFDWPGQGSEHSTAGRIGLIVDRGVDNLFDDGCRVLGTPSPSNGTASCSTERFTGPGGERARISRYQRLCGSWDPGREGDDARPGPGSTYATCGDFRVAVAVERRDGLIGYVDVDGRGTSDFNPFPAAAMAAAAADPRLTLPETAYAVPSDQAVVSVAKDHFPRFRDRHEATSPHPGVAAAYGSLGRLGFGVSVWPAGETPTCGGSSLVECVERRVFGADDPTTVFVGSWDVEDWASEPKDSRASSREFVYVGPRHTVVVRESRVVLPGEEPVSAELDQRVIDLLLDPRLQ